MLIERHERGLKINYQDSPSLSAVGELGQSAFLADLVVTTSGEFVAIDSVEAYAGRLQSQLASQLGDSDTLGLSSAMGMLTPEALSATAAQEWNILVGFWIGGHLQLGEIYEDETQMPFPLIPGATVSATTAFQAFARIPCDEESTTRDCVELRLVTMPDPDALAELLAHFLHTQAADPDERISDMTMRVEVSLVTEPSTLLPHALEVTREAVLQMEGPDGARQQRGLDIRSTVYRYRNRST